MFTRTKKFAAMTAALVLCLSFPLTASANPPAEKPPAPAGSSDIAPNLNYWDINTARYEGAGMHSCADPGCPVMEWARIGDALFSHCWVEGTMLGGTTRWDLVRHMRTGVYGYVNENWLHYQGEYLKC